MNPLKVGMAVIVRSNNDEPLRYGKIIAFDSLEGKAREPIPVVQIGRDPFWVMGAVLEDTPYNRELLADLTPQEQWLLCCRLKET